MCHDTCINNLRDMSKNRLHTSSNVGKLDDRRDINLYIMINLNENNLYRKEVSRLTKTTLIYVFNVDIAHLGLYA